MLPPLPQRELIAWLQQQGRVARRGLITAYGLGLSAVLALITQCWLLADLLQQGILNPHQPLRLGKPAMAFFGVLVLRAGILWGRERVSFQVGLQVRAAIRQQLLDQLERLGPLGRADQPVGSWSSLLLEQVDHLHDYYARYLPQRMLVLLVPVTILAVIFPINWVAGALFVITAPLIPLFMILVGHRAAEANRLNLQALTRLSGHFLDRLRALETLRLFDRATSAHQEVEQISQRLRQRTMAVLRLAFVSSAVLEFFTALSIALVALYFGFTYLGALHCRLLPTEVTLFSGLFTLMLAPEFYQPLRDLGSFYHAKAQALAAAQGLCSALQHNLSPPTPLKVSRQRFSPAAQLVARELTIYSHLGHHLVGPLNFEVAAGSHQVIVGASGAGKSTLLHLLLGFLPYQGSCTLEGIELRELDHQQGARSIAWVGQTPQLLAGTLLDNIRLRDPTASEQVVALAVQRAAVDRFLPDLPHGLLTSLSNNACELSVGQAQRVVLARALLCPCDLLLLDEPTASLDSESEQLVQQALSQASRQQTTLTITHRLEILQASDQLWVMQQGRIVQQGAYIDLSQQPGPLADLLAHRSYSLCTEDSE
jgi:ATP-binding cassette, subfamily C, bacterial CydD